MSAHRDAGPDAERRVETSDGPTAGASRWLPGDRALATGAACLAVAAIAVWVVVAISLVHRSHPLWIRIAFLCVGPVLLTAAWLIWRTLAGWIGQAALGRRFVLVPIALVCLVLGEIAVAALGEEARWTCLPIFALASALGLLIGEGRDLRARAVRWLPLSLMIGYFVFALLLVQTLLRPLDFVFATSLGGSSAIEPVGRFDDLLDPPATGSPPRTLRYGVARTDDTLDDLPSRTFDARPVLSGWSGFTGWLRARYFGFGPEALPLRGRIWLPPGELAGPHPLIAVVHGNHPMEEPSAEGFAYLCDALARRGFICVSIDLAFLNTSYLADLFGGLEGDRLVRSGMVLEHLDLIRTWNDTPGHPLHRLVDLDEIGLVGHSRGGAVVVMAADSNARGRLERWPGASLPDAFRIRSVTALAPVEIAPADRPDDGQLALDDTSYLVLQGSQDTDIHSFEGSLQVARMDPRAGDGTLAASFHFAGGNHSQFNTEWGENDKPALLAPLVDSRGVMSADLQRALTLAVLTRFLEAVHRGDEGDREWLLDPRDLSQRLGAGRLAHRFRDDRSVELAGFDEDEDPTTATLAGGVVSAVGFELATEEQIERRWIDALELSRSLRLGWPADPGGAAPRLSISFPDETLSLAADDRLLFDLALDVHAEDAPAPVSLDVELVDQSGRRARATLRDAVSYLSAGPAPLYHARILNPRSEILPTTMSLRIGDFEAVDPGFDPARLRELRLLFDPTRAGTLLIDGIALRRAT